MPKSTLSLEERIAKLEHEKQQLINKRKDEIAELFVKHKAVTIDNKVIIGLIKHYQHALKNGDDNTDQLLSELRSKGAKSPSPSQSHKQAQQPA